MTREEAIAILIREINEDPFMRTEYRELIHGALNVAIKALEQEPRWIPVSERLPEKDGRYLAYIINQFDDKLRYIMTCEYLVGDFNGWCPDDECSSNNVVAWMPLPEPYKAESEGKE